MADGTQDPLRETNDQMPGDIVEQSQDSVETVPLQDDKSIENTYNTDAETQPDAVEPAIPENTIVPETIHPKKSNKKLFIALAVFLLASAGAAVWFFLFRASESAETVDTSNQQVEAKRFGVATGLVEGAVEYSKDDGTNWTALTEDADLAEGDQVRTLSDGRVVLLIDDGSATRLATNSSLELTSLKTDSIVITNLSGETYNRVVASESRKYSVVSSEQTYVAKGTAFRTFNSDTKKGVEVFHSTVGVVEKTTDVTEGNAFFELNEQKEKENTVSAIDLTLLKKDEFIKWNSELDKKTAEFANALGVLAELDKPDPVPVPAPQTQSTNQPSGISLSSSVSEYSANFSWRVSGVDTSKGFKLVKSVSSQSPTYPKDSAAYIESGKSSYSLYLGDGKTYYFRICAYRGNSCDSYSNSVTVTTPVKPKVQVQTGAVNLSVSGTTANWTFAGTAPFGFKLVGGQSTGPVYKNAEFTMFSNNTSTEIQKGLSPGATYFLRVCKYTDGNCVDYSNEVTYIAP